LGEALWECDAPSHRFEGLKAKTSGDRGDIREPETEQQKTFLKKVLTRFCRLV